MKFFFYTKHYGSRHIQAESLISYTLFSIFFFNLHVLAISVTERFSLSRLFSIADTKDYKVKTRPEMQADFTEF